jgi:hypothetical protein
MPGASRPNGDLTMTMLHRAAQAIHLRTALLYAAVTTYFAGFFAAVEYALASLVVG